MVGNVLNTDVTHIINKHNNTASFDRMSDEKAIGKSELSEIF